MAKQWRSIEMPLTSNRATFLVVSLLLLNHPLVFAQTKSGELQMDLRNSDVDTPIRRTINLQPKMDG